MQKTVRVLGALGLAVGGLLLLAKPAGAHVTATEDELPHDSYTTIELNQPHGCGDEEDEDAPASPTKAVRVQIPEEVSNVKPAVHPGWDIDIVAEELDPPLEGPYGDPITERVTEVTWTAQEGNELPDEHRTSFKLGLRTTFTTPGEYVFFKTITECIEGEDAWVEEYIRGVSEGEEPDYPSPVVLIVDEDEAEDGEDAASSSGDSDDGASAVAWAALVVGVLGLVAGGLALARSRSAGAS